MLPMTISLFSGFWLTLWEEKSEWTHNEKPKHARICPKTYLRVGNSCKVHVHCARSPTHAGCFASKWTNRHHYGMDQTMWLLSQLKEILCHGLTALLVHRSKMYCPQLTSRLFAMQAEERSVVAAKSTVTKKLWGLEKNLYCSIQIMTASELRIWSWPVPQMLTS